MKTTIYYFSYAALCLTAILSGCQTKEADPVNNNQSLVNASSTEYIIADVDGVSGLTKLNLQDSDSANFKPLFNLCFAAPYFVNMTIDGPGSQGVSIFFFTSSWCSTFRQGIAVQPYTTASITPGYANLGYCSPAVNGGGTCGNMQNGTSNMDFEITQITTINGVEYVLGEFNVYLANGDMSKLFWLKNGIFKFRTQ